MSDRNGKLAFFKTDILWTVVLTAFFAINMNFDWHANGAIWYGILFLTGAMYLFVFGGRIPLLMSGFSKWMLSFIILSVVSLSWSLSAETGMDVIKNQIIIFVALLLIQFSMEYGYSIICMLKGYFVATLVNMVYILMTIDVEKLGDIQLGTGLIDNWNGNSVGFIMTQGAFIGVYLFGQSKEKLSKLLYLAGTVAFFFVTMYTGSRTAFIMLVAGLVLYFWLCHPTKMVSNVIITAAVLYIAYYLAMNVESFYKVLGSRLEGLFALFSGEGEVDNSANVRNIFIENGKRWFSEEPFLGYGINNYKVLNRGATGRFTYAHNTFVELAVDLGVVGLFWYYAAYAYLGKRFFAVIKKNKLNIYLFAAFLASFISQYGSVSYYGFYQNFLLMLCFYAVSRGNKEGTDVLK